MTRGLGAIDAAQAALPAWATPIVVAVTQLGDVWFVLVLSTLVYWFRDRRGGGFALTTVLGALALTAGLKALFALPRPPASLRLVAVDSYGFPSGHAVAATAAWGVLAVVLDAGTRRGRLTLAVGVVLLVSLSRIALGVHYAVDVVAGVAVGGAYLAAALWATNRDPSRAALGAVLVALAALVLGGGADAAGFLGAGLAALAVLGLADVPSRPWERRGVLPAVGAAVLVGGVALLVYDDAMTSLTAFGLGAVAVGVVLAAPLVAD